MPTSVCVYGSKLIEFTLVLDGNLKAEMFNTHPEINLETEAIHQSLSQMREGSEPTQWVAFPFLSRVHFADFCRQNFLFIAGSFYF